MWRIALLKSFYKKIFIVVVAVVIFSWLIPARLPADMLKFEPKVALKLKHNDNLFLKEKIKVDDFISSLLLQLKFTYGQERFEVHPDVVLEGVKYRENDDVDAVNQYYGLRFAAKVSPTINFDMPMYYLNDTFLGLESQEAEETGILLLQVDREKEYVNPKVTFALTELSSLEAAYIFLNNHYDDPKWDDYHVSDGSVVFQHRFKNEKTIGIAKISHQYFDYDNGDVRNYSLPIGIQHRLSPIFEFQILAGARYTTFKFDSTEKQADVIANASITKRFERFHLRLSGGRELIGSAFGNNLIRSGGKAKLDYNISEVLRAAVAVNYSWNKWPTKSKRLKYVLTRIDAGFRYSYSESVSFGLGYRWLAKKDRVYHTKAYSNQFFVRCTVKSAFLY